MSIAKIRFAPDILRRLGEELNPHPADGIIELVKNSYDADARKCVVTLTDTDDVGGSILVTDDGDGMTPDQIKKGWLVVGSSQKRKKRLTRLKRVPAGSKGLGRLAALRLGRFATLNTSPRLNKLNSYRMIIDWKLFDDAPLIDDVDLAIDELRKRPDLIKGTSILLDKLRSRIGRNDVKRLARAMLILADPFGDSRIGFQPKLIAPEFLDIERLVEKRYFDNASYHLKASVNSAGSASARLFDSRGALLFSADHDDIFPKEDEPALDCPPLKFEFWTFLLNQSTFSTLPVTLNEVREWLGVFGGVHVYQNNLRVAPYGDEGHDWLDLNVSRAKSPEERPSTNNSIGRVRISDKEESLVQKTDRSGFIETEAFNDIKRICKATLNWMASRRLEIAEKKRIAARSAAPNKVTKSKRILEKAIEAAPSSIRVQLREAADNYNKSRDREVDELRKEVQLYRTLSTAGITAATFAHESKGNPHKVIVTSIGTIERRSKELLGLEYELKIQPAVDRIKAALDSLSVLDNVTLSLLDHDKRKIGGVYIHKVTEDIVKMFRPFLLSRNVKIDLDFAEGSPWLHGSDAAIESVITNLINNSVTALEDNSPDERAIRITTLIQEDVLRVAVLDSGVGLRDIKKPDIWLPGKTTRLNGTGLGLTIVKDTVTDLGGKVGVIEASALGGVEIYFELPVFGV